MTFRDDMNKYIAEMHEEGECEQDGSYELTEGERKQIHELVKIVKDISADASDVSATIKPTEGRGNLVLTLTDTLHDITMDVPVWVGNMAVSKDCEIKGFSEEYDESMHDYVNVAFVRIFYAGYEREYPETYDLTATDSYFMRLYDKVEDGDNMFKTRDLFMDRLASDLTHQIIGKNHSKAVFTEANAEFEHK